MKYDKPKRFRDFLNQYGRLSPTDLEKRMAYEGFMASLGMFAFLYALLTAPDFIFQSYLSPHATILLGIGAVVAIWTAARWQYLAWRKRATPPN